MQRLAQVTDKMTDKTEGLASLLKRQRGVTQFGSKPGNGFGNAQLATAVTGLIIAACPLRNIDKMQRRASFGGSCNFVENICTQNELEPFVTNSNDANNAFTGPMIQQVKNINC